GLNNKHKLGFISVGDTHDGRPGDALHELQVKPEIYKDLHKPGLTGIWAKDLTRESIFDALWNRRVYGTTHQRVIVKFSANDFPMGSIIKVKDKIKLEAEIASELIIEKIELIQEGHVIKTIEPMETTALFGHKIELSTPAESW